jgi:endonuclease YncB( thermonuclease family)
MACGRRVLLVLIVATVSRVMATEASGISTTAVGSCTHTENAFRCVQFVKNYDADTITFDIPGVHPLIGKNIGVRVRHVDTPEMRGGLPCEKAVAKAAQKQVETLLKRAKRIDLVNVGKDKYFRILADVIIDGHNLKDYLIKNQLAYAYDGGTKKKLNWCARQTASQ